MNPGDVPTWIGSGIAFIVGGVGIVYGVLGYRQAKKSNRTAADAVEAAARANGIAEEANQLSKEANALAARSVAAQEEDWFVDWRLHWDAGVATLTLSNTGSHTARETAVTVSTRDLYFDSSQLGDIGPAQILSVPVAEVATARSVHEAERVAAQRTLQATGVAYVGARFSTTLKVTVRWKTGLGFPKSKEFEVEAK